MEGNGVFPVGPGVGEKFIFHTEGKVNHARHNAEGELKMSVKMRVQGQGSAQTGLWDTFQRRGASIQCESCSPLLSTLML